MSKLDRCKAAEATGEQVLDDSLTQYFGFMSARERQNGPRNEYGSLTSSNAASSEKWHGSKSGLRSFQ